MVAPEDGQFRPIYVDYLIIKNWLLLMAIIY
jgi:hypothetical protein